jgi:ferredoxin
MTRSPAARGPAPPPGGQDFDLAEGLDSDLTREGLREAHQADQAAHDGTGRVQLEFTVQQTPDPHGTAAPPVQRGVRVPPGVSVFDAASWNGIAIDSTCGGHGTCHKCKVKIEGGSPAWSTRPVT